MKKITLIFILLFSMKVFAQASPKDTIRVENYPTDSISTKTSESDVQVLTDMQRPKL